MAVYFGEGGLVRGMSRFIEMIITAGPAFFVFQVGTTMHYFDNNIVHGGAKYQATGRGFKITRETLVLLYKAYASSHYRKAWELVGLCVIYGLFGNFRICKLEGSPGEDTFGQDYCKTAQGYGVQTFSVWFISILWLVSPFIFNTDGLDFEKTKVDIGQWAVWMFANDDYKDDDPTNTGGWIGWWKGDLQQLHNSNMVARFTVILRESRHFVLMFYIATLITKEVKYVTFVLAAAGATLVLLGFAAGIGMGLRSVRPIIRAGLYLTTLLLMVVGYFVGMYAYSKSKNEDPDLKRDASLFLGYFAALYGFNEMARMWSFSGSSIASNPVFQQLAFLFDFMFCVGLIVPLFVMSCVPFLNVIQTRMMYNEGFSKVMSASSQYALSLATFMGLLGGAGCGWLFSLLSTLEQSASFLSYVITYKGILGSGNVGDGRVSFIFYGGSAFGTIISGFLGYFLGRRLSIVVGGLVTMAGMVAVCSTGDLLQSLFLPGIGILGCSVGILLPSLAIYIYEISTKEMRGKTILMLGTGFIGGTLMHAIFSTVNQVGWVWQAFVASLMIAMITPVVNVFPESPYWILERKGWEACEACLVILRRKQDVSDELKQIREEETGNEGNGNSSFKFILGVFLMFVSSLSTGVLYAFMYAKAGTGNDETLFRGILLELIGSALAFFFIDKLDHKSVLFGTLIPVALCAGVIGFDQSSKFLDKTGNGSLYFSIITLLMYFFLGLGTSTALWTACIGMFTTKNRAVSTTFLFTLFSVLPIGHVFMITRNSDSSASSLADNEYVYLYGLAGVCLVTIVLLVGAGTKSNGVICTRSEAEADNERRRRQRAESRALRTPGSTRNRNMSRTRAKSSAGGYNAYESPGGRLSRRQPNV